MPFRTLFESIYWIFEIRQIYSLLKKMKEHVKKEEDIFLVSQPGRTFDYLIASF